MKLFGSKRTGARLAQNRSHYLAQSGSSGRSASAAVQTVSRQSNPLKILAIILAIILVLELCYFFVVHTKNSFISYWRSVYIETAMDTLSHKWLATLVFPSDMIAQVMSNRTDSLASMEGMESTWGPAVEQEPDISEPIDKVPDQEEPIVQDPEEIEMDVTVVPDIDPIEAARNNFYDTFYELDVSSMETYLEQHPEALDNGWDKIYINEAGMDDNGTEIETIHGEQVLAIDAANKVLLLRVEGSGYIGVLAVAKDPSLLAVHPSSQLGVSGEYAGTIAENNNGVLGITGSGFIDPDGNGNGGLLAGYAMCDGVAYGSEHMGWGYKRLELHEDNLFYIKDSTAAVGEGTTDAVEFQPALIIDGNIVVDANCGWTGLHPRACIGQNDKYEILMLVIEGRMPWRSTGTHVIECAEILKLHGCMQAMNLDGGTSAIMWYDGEYVTKCSNQNLPSGRPLPTAFVYHRAG